MTARDPHTLALAVAAVNATSKAAVAREIGRSRTAVSLYIDGKYPADPGEVEAAIRARYDRPRPARRRRATCCSGCRRTCRL